MKRDNLLSRHPLILLPGFVAMNAKTTVMVLASTQDTAIAKIMPKAICRNRQVTFPGHPMNSKEHKKQSMRVMRSIKVKLLLLALTIGVFQCIVMIPRTQRLMTRKRTAKAARTLPNDSL